MGDYQLEFFIPELLIMKSQWRELLLGDVYNTVKVFIIDEAHCIKKW